MIKPIRLDMPQMCLIDNVIRSCALCVKGRRKQNICHLMFAGLQTGTRLPIGVSCPCLFCVCHSSTDYFKQIGETTLFTIYL